MEDITGKLRDVSQVMLLLGGPWRRGMEQGVCQRLVVSEQGKLPPLQEETEVTNSRVSSQELPVEGRILGFGGFHSKRNGSSSFRGRENRD